MTDLRMPDGTLSDGCTAWPDGPWAVCCVEHDRAYRSGGGGFWLRRRADLRLMACVSQSGYPFIGFLMFLGVEAFGWIPWQKNARYYAAARARKAMIHRAEERRARLSRARADLRRIRDIRKHREGL